MKIAALRGRGWRALDGLGQAGRVSGGGAGRTSTVASSSTPAGGTAAQISLAQRAAQMAAKQTPQNTPVTTVQRNPLGQTVAQQTTLPTTQQYSQAMTCPTGSVLDYWGEACVPVQTQAVATTTTVASPITCPSGYTVDSTGTTCVATTTQTDYLPWILGGAGVFLLMMMMASRR